MQCVSCPRKSKIICKSKMTLVIAILFFQEISIALANSCVPLQLNTADWHFARNNIVVTGKVTRGNFTVTTDEDYIATKNIVPRGHTFVSIRFNIVNLYAGASYLKSPINFIFQHPCAPCHPSSAFDDIFENQIALVATKSLSKSPITIRTSRRLAIYRLNKQGYKTQNSIIIDQCDYHGTPAERHPVADQYFSSHKK